jgi:hypothetical protein
MLRNRLLIIITCFTFLFSAQGCKKDNYTPSIEGEWRSSGNEPEAFKYLQFTDKRFKLRAYDKDKGYDITETGSYYIDAKKDILHFLTGSDDFVFFVKYPNLSFGSPFFQMNIAKYPYIDSLNNTCMVIEHKKSKKDVVNITYIREK